MYNRGSPVCTSLLVDAKKICYTLPCVIEFRRDAMFYTDEEISVITGFLNGYLVRDHASAKVRESYSRSIPYQRRALDRNSAHSPTASRDN